MKESGLSRFSDFRRVRALVREISEETKLMDASDRVVRSLKYRAFFDGKTGALRYDETSLLAYIKKQKESSPSPLYYFRFDLDEFSLYNKRRGHREGDRVLALFAQFLIEAFPKGRVYRYGGDEFDAVSAFEEERISFFVEDLKQSWTEIGCDAPLFSCGHEKIGENFSIARIQDVCDRLLFENKRRS